MLPWPNIQHSYPATKATPGAQVGRSHIGYARIGNRAHNSRRGDGRDPVVVARAQARDDKVDDVGYVRALVGRLKAQVNVDSTRIFAIGMSNGGMLSHRLACEMADVFNAVASVAGTEGTASCHPSRPISVLHIHARNDTHVLFNGGAGPDAFRDPSKVTDFTSVPETISRWVARNRCATGPVRTLQRPGAMCETYSGCDGDVKVQLCVTESGGHSWPGARTVRRGKEGAAQALSANDVMWEFFKASNFR